MPHDPAAGPHPAAHTRPGLTLFAACLGIVVIILDVSVVNVAIKALSADFGGSLSGLEWVVNGYTLTFAGFLLTAGAMGDRFDPKRIFLWGFVLFALASLACGAAPDLVALITARIVQGVGAAMIVPSSLSIVTTNFPDPARRTRAVSLWAAAGGLALALGPVVGGVLVATAGWRSIFYVNLPVAAIGVVITARYARSAAPRDTAPSDAASKRPARGLDLPGQVLAVVGLGALTGAVVEANAQGWGSPLVLTCLAVFVLALVGFLRVERRSADPMLPLRLFGHGVFRTTSLIGVLINFSFYGLIFVFSLFFQQVWGFSPIRTGLAFLPMTAAIMTANLSSGPLTKRYGTRTVLVVGSVLAALGYLLTLPAIGGHSYTAMLVQFLVAGFGTGLVVPAMTNAMLTSVDPAHAGIASGVLNASRQVGGLVGVAVMGLLVGQASSPHFRTGLQTALATAVVALAVSAVLSAVGIRARRAEKDAPTHVVARSNTAAAAAGAEAEDPVRSA
ncbi:MFS transporter [Streptacidiphilus fuscans]|uniref:MFS transporter n=1 Tax=Streptacidiphilus fuscans TaxID=2789292 RepID=A0A931B0F6_9ACTN|nr:MFS transporter [Streptacidiphilus fuscans]MBF9066862.1 MFS transporter [Streptacidiphilus fuscans]